MADTPQTKIGKDVIDSITLSMYEDPHIIYREYIQNSADQIDIAAHTGVLADIKSGTIEIKINKGNNSISVEDNATGIESNKVNNVLKNIAQSSKRRDFNKGFRGIGRLGGIAYCKKLVFETSFKGEAIKSTLTWDAEKLKKIINNRTKNEEATEVIDAVTEFKTKIEDEEKHYFKVTLQSVDNERLLSVEKVREYLSMVAPVGYERGFIFKDKIYEELKSKGLSIDEYQIFVNTDKIEKAYTTTIYEGKIGNKSKIDEIIDLKFFPVQDSNDNLLAYGWYGISNFEKQIPGINIARGIRLRKNNIQIGNNDTLIPFFKEQRGNNYYFGEIFALDKNLIPNARRDYFVENDTLKSFERMLTNVLRKPLNELYHFASNVRSQFKKIEEFNTFKEKYEKKAEETGFSTTEEKKRDQEKLESLEKKGKTAENYLKKLQNKIDDDNDPKSKIFKNIAAIKPKLNNTKIDTDAKNKKTKYVTDDLSRLTRNERKLLSKVFGLIDVVLSPDLATNLKDKIKTAFK